MKIKVSLILSAVAILKAIDTTKMKLSTSYKVKTVLSACQLAIEDFEAKRIKIAKKYGTLSEDKTHYDFTEEGSQEAFQKKMKAILEDTIDIDIKKKIPLKLIDNYINVEPCNINLVEWFIDGFEDL